jgi:acid phosphatase
MKKQPAGLAGFLLAVTLTCTGPANADVSGVVAGEGYYRNVTVCRDANGNGRCDRGEARAVTDDNGRFTLPGRAGALVAEIPQGAVVSDPAAGTTAMVARPLVFRAPAAAAAAASVVLGPVSTELQALLDAGGKFPAASAALAQRLGVADALADPNAASGPDRDALRAESGQVTERIADAVAEAGAKGSRPRALRSRLALDAVTNVVVIYAENRSFDNLFGLFPGANGLKSKAAATVKQVDRDGSALSKLPPAWGNLTAPGQTPVVTQAQTTNVWPNAPFQLDAKTDRYGYGVLPQGIITRDLYHRFFENAMQIDGDKSDRYVAWADSGGTVMGYFDTRGTRLWALARQYTLADNFFQGAYGGSFLNHFYLICACAASVPADVVAANKMSLNVLAAPVNGVPQLAANDSQKPSAMDGAASLKTGNIAPLDYFGTGDGYRAVNTMQPPFQPSGNKPADNAGDHARYSNPAAGTWTPPQTQATIGDLLTAKGIGWAWYAGGWAAASANPYPFDAATNGFGASTTIYYANSSGTSDATHTDLQAHHQPFNYFAGMDPVAHAAERAAHLKDRADLLSDAKAGSLPPVAFYKPVGFANQHPGYANITDGDNEIAEVVNALRASPQWKHMLVVVTYDEFGGQFDHVAPPKGDLMGPGTRIPAVIISPLARKGFVDHTPYDTASILRFITHRYSLPMLPGLKLRDDSLVKNGGRPMGDLTNALK